MGKLFVVTNRMADQIVPLKPMDDASLPLEVGQGRPLRAAAPRRARPALVLEQPPEAGRLAGMDLRGGGAG